jgi:hypothetical protein
MRLLLDLLDAPLPGHLRPAPRDPPPPLQMVAVETLPLEPGSDLVPLERFCFGCHRGNPVDRLDFMRGDTEGEVWDNILAARNLDEVLDWKRYEGTLRAMTLMPPTTSAEYRHLQITRADGADPLADIKRAIASHAAAKP